MAVERASVPYALRGERTRRAVDWLLPALLGLVALLPMTFVLLLVGLPLLAPFSAAFVLGLLSARWSRLRAGAQACLFAAGATGACCAVSWVASPAANAAIGVGLGCTTGLAFAGGIFVMGERPASRKRVDSGWA
jgi:hypothetical protein